MNFRFPIYILLLSIVSSVAFAASPVDVRQYLTLRKKLCTAIPIEQLKADAGLYIGKTFEIRGTVSGFCKNDTGENMILTSRDGGSYIVAADGLPVENPGVELVCLVKIGVGSTHSLSDVRLVACTHEVDLRKLEDAWQKAAEAKTAKAKSKPEQCPATKTAEQNKSQLLTSDDLVRIYKNAIKSFNKKLSENQADTIARSILGFSYQYHVDPRLVCAVILAESNFRIGATSSCGAQGLGQLMPGTAAGLGVSNAYDPVENVYGSVRYIRSMLERTSFDVTLALAAYNAGPGAVKKHGGIPPYKETQNYVRKVTSIYKQLCGVK